jgi:phytoene dehydrogenase-like protein
MTSLELFEEWFESPALRAALASVAIHGHTLGPMSAGTGSGSAPGSTTGR